MKIEKNKELKELTTMGISAKARWFVEYDSIEELRYALKLFGQGAAPEGEPEPSRPILHIGGGSNLLFLQDYDGCVLHSGIKNTSIMEEDEGSVTLRVGAGIVWDTFVDECLQKGYYGLENLSGIPGEVGASAVQNVGAYGTEAKDFIVRVETIDLNTGETRIFHAQECHYAYRHSIFKQPELFGRYAVTYVHYRLNKTFSPQLSYAALNKAWECLPSEAKSKASAIRSIVISMRNEKLPDPHILGNCGSFFMNPIITKHKFESLQAEYPDIPAFAATDGMVKVPAAWLIQQCGWKGKRIGNCGVYEHQALVLVNHGGATGKELAALSDSIRASVQERFDIDIHPEANFI
ncbi:MAG: UDP-N-acetylmuramate dehydrogenase [Bacteroidales bacterium]|nr:UDP-N-acetylmuramate dehydrogenase [Candidatus Physcousia equi]